MSEVYERVIAQKEAEIERLLRRPPVPWEDELWDAHDLAGYFKVSPRTAAEKIAVRPSFPDPIRVSGNRWRAGDVIEWARRQRGAK